VNKRQRKKKAKSAWVNVMVPRACGKGKVKARFNVHDGRFLAGLSKNPLCSYSIPSDYFYHSLPPRSMKLWN